MACCDSPGRFLEGFAMGRIRTAAVRRIGNGRRNFLRRTGAAAIALGSMSLLGSCGGSDADPVPVPSGSGPFRHGVASGDPLADRVILWTRVTPDSTAAVSVECVVATDPALANVVVRQTFATDASIDYTVKTDVSGLQPATTYYYRFAVAGTSSPIGRTRTLPAGTATRLRLVVVSCSNLAKGYFNAYRRVAERADLDLVLHLGDYIYEHGVSGGDVRVHEPANETVTLSDYRTRYAQYRRDADLQELHRQHPMIAIWDDHDIASNANVAGSENHTEGAEGTWVARVAAALQAHYEWMPVRVVDAANPRKDYRGFAYGNLVDLTMLEERVLARSPQLPTNTSIDGVFTQSGAFTDPSREMLGSEQEAWLAGRLRSSTAKWKFIGQGVMLAQLKILPGTNASGGGRFINADQWDGYQPARDRLFDMLKGSGGLPAVDNVVVLTGDAHSSWAADLTQDPNNANVAAGGYDPSNGAGSRAVEFVDTSVTSPTFFDTFGLAEATLRSINPHLKYIELTRRGYMLIDADASRVVGEWWYVDTVTSPSNGHTFGAAWQVQDGTGHLVPGGQTAPRANPPVLAP
jgi:alkaline phosphatase D